MPSLDLLPEFCPRNLADWRKWLKRNHEESPGTWVIFYKKASGKQGLTYSEAVDEALCWGWIDSKAVAIDEERYRQVFTPRKPRSMWSALNKRKIAAMIEQGRMQAAGLTKIEAAKSNGTWEAIDRVEALEMPPELERALGKKPKARATYDALTAAKRKLLLHWLNNAKREETRTKRIKAIVDALAAGKMPSG